MKTYYKWLRKDGLSPFQRAAWHLPHENSDGGWTPGAWMPELDGSPVECQHGYHICDVDQVLGWTADRLYEVEVDGPVSRFDDKHATTARCRLTRQTAWDEKTSPTLACDFAEHVLPIYERVYPDDARPRRRIKTRRRYLNDKATHMTASVARDDALRAAMKVREARYLATPTTGGKTLLDAAWHAARAATCVTAWDTANAATAAASCHVMVTEGEPGGGIAERRWQRGRILTVLEGDDA